VPEVAERLRLLEAFDVALVAVGIALLLAALLPLLLEHRPLAMPVVVLGLGFAVFALPLGLEPPDPLEEPELAKRLTELGVIVAIMGAGLKIDRPPGWRRWLPTILLLTITMPLTIAAAALLGWAIGGLVAATAALFGAAIAPTDPVLAHDVEARPPEERSDSPEDEVGEEESEVRFSLTSEAGLNDALAFPFTMLAVAMVLKGAAPANWLPGWLAWDVAYRLSAALVLGYLVAKVLARLLFSYRATTPLARLMIGLGAIAATLVVYGTTELAGGYGFLAVFVAAVTIRNHDPGHPYQEAMRELTEATMRMLVAVILLLLGGAVAGGLLGALTWELVAVALLLVIVVRPAAGAVALLPLRRADWMERGVIAFFGVRGVGSLYYVAFALTEADFAQQEELWSLLGLVVVVSVLLHGLTSSVVMDALARRDRAS
jgi:sodium/hydrogen antiporter